MFGRFAKRQLHNFVFNPGVALVTYKAAEKSTSKGEQLPSNPTYLGSGYLKRGGEWVNFYTQTTLAP